MNCPGQGLDKRFLHWLVCPLQRLLSWKSDKPPRLICGPYPLQIVQDDYYFELLPYIGIFFPPYIIVQKKCKNMKWFMFRFGWRYDVNWKGYIFPTAAIKFDLIDPMTRGY